MVPLPPPFVVPEIIPSLDFGPALGTTAALAVASALVVLAVLIAGLIAERHRTIFLLAARRPVRPADLSSAA
jgi:hypothetical protein